MAMLPPLHRRVLALNDEGFGAAEIAVRLHFEPESVALLLKVARAKLAALERVPEPVVSDE